MLRDLKEEGSAITLITRPVETTDALRPFEDLARDGIELYFCPLLHSKLYVFVVDRAQQRQATDYDDLVVMGSANLTLDGIVEPQRIGNEELCVALGNTSVQSLETYILDLMNKSSDLMGHKLELARRKKSR